MKKKKIWELQSNYPLFTRKKKLSGSSAIQLESRKFSLNEGKSCCGCVVKEDKSSSADVPSVTYLLPDVAGKPMNKEPSKLKTGIGFFSRYDDILRQLYVYAYMNT